MTGKFDLQYLTTIGDCKMGEKKIKFSSVKVFFGKKGEKYVKRFKTWLFLDHVDKEVSHINFVQLC